MKNKKFKNLLNTLLIMGLFMTTTSVFANTSPIQQEKLNNGDVIINGEVQATVVSITVPQSISFILNPNGTTPEERFISPTFSIENNSNAPLSVTIQSLKNKEDSPHKFTDVSPDKYTDEEWGKLNKVQSMGEIGLSIVSVNTNEWRDGKIEQFDAVDSNKQIGTLNPHSSASLKLIAKHGSSFESLQSNYQISFIFDLFDNNKNNNPLTKNLVKLLWDENPNTFLELNHYASTNYYTSKEINEIVERDWPNTTSINNKLPYEFEVSPELWGETIGFNAYWRGTIQTENALGEKLSSIYIDNLGYYYKYKLLIPEKTHKITITPDARSVIYINEIWIEK